MQIYLANTAVKDSTPLGRESRQNLPQSWRGLFCSDWGQDQPQSPGFNGFLVSLQILTGEAFRSKLLKEDQKYQKVHEITLQTDVENYNHLGWTPNSTQSEGKLLLTLVRSPMTYEKQVTNAFLG